MKNLKTKEKISSQKYFLFAKRQSAVAVIPFQRTKSKCLKNNKTFPNFIDLVDKEIIDCNKQGKMVEQLE